jgi:hypothetical protein
MAPKETTPPDEDLSNLDAEEQKLRDEAAATDPVRPEDAEIEDDAHKVKRDQATRTADETAKKTTPGDDKKPDDNASKDKKPDPKADAPKAAEDAKEDESKLSPYERDRRRLNRNRQEFEQEKANERKKLADERAALEEERKKIRAAASAPKEKPKHNGYTAEEYDEVAKGFEAEGKLKEAEYAKARAKELREQEAKQGGDAQPADGAFITLPTGARITAAEKQRFESEWNANLAKIAEQNADLTKEGAPLRNEVAALLKRDEQGNLLHPILHSHPSGIHYAVEVAKLKLAAAEVPTLKERIAQLETENKRLTDLTSLPPSGGGGEGRREKPKPEEMTDIEQAETALREEAMAEDARR